jgi:hypothetical protein
MAGVTLGSDFTMIDDELRSAGKQVRKAYVVAPTFERIRRLDLYPRQGAPLGADPISEP